MILGRVVAFFTLAVPVFAQYAGPAILSRGDAPTGLAQQQLGFVPDFEISGVYDTGLAGAAISAKGQLGNVSSPGIEFSGGISGNHSWRHTQLGLHYHGSLTHFEKATFYDGSNQSLELGFTQQFTRHIILQLRETAGMLSTGVASTALAEGVPFDPSQTILPATNFIDNRTVYLSTSAILTYQQSTRLSYSFSGTGFLNRRRSAELAGVTGAIAAGDVQYRISLRTTIGADYNYANYTFTRVYSSSDTQSVHGNYSTAISKNLQVSAFAGIARAESKAEQEVAVDPLIAALLGITQGLTVNHAIKYVPSASGRISRTLPHGVLYASGSRMIIPGNGLFLTSDSTMFTAGYSYTGLRNWSLTSYFSFSRNTTLGVTGKYGSTAGTISLSHALRKSLSVIGSFTGSDYESGTYALFNRTIYSMKLGLGWTPGNIPLRIW